MKRRCLWPGLALVKLVVSVLALIPAIGHANGSIDDATRKPVVLIIGVADYGKWGGLKGSAYDTCALYSLYRHLLLVPAANIIVHMNVAPGIAPPCQIPDVQPVSAAAIHASTTILTSRRPAASAMYLHFSGHGFEEAGEPRLVLSVDEVGKVAEAIPLAVLLRGLRAAPVAPLTVAVFVDACRDTAMATGETERSAAQSPGAIETASRTLDGLVGAVYMAASPGEYSYTRRSIHGSRSNQLMGYFTWAVIRGLVGGARTGDGAITFQSLADYLQKEVPLARRHELGGAVTEPQHPEAVMLSSSSPSIRMDAPTAARLSQSFLFYAEASVEPQNQAGQSLAGPFSFDIMTPQAGRSPTELNLLGATVVQPPGPFKLPLPSGMDIPATVHQWAFSVRTVFFWGPNRREFIVCSISPRIPEAGTVDPEIVAAVDTGSLVIDVRGAWRKIGHWISQMDDIFDPTTPPEHPRAVAKGCQLA